VHLDKPLLPARRGVVLLWSLVLLAVSTTILGALGGYYVHSGRLANEYRKMTPARFAVQQRLDALSRRFLEVADVLNGKTVAGAVGTPGADEGKTLRERVEAALQKAGFTVKGDGPRAGGGVFVRTSPTEGETEVRGLENLDALDGTTEGRAATLDVYSTVRSGGVPIRLRQTITFELKVDPSRTRVTLASHPIFNYVYFANNCGHLESKGIVANGDVGANDRFTIDGATVNGRVTACRTSPGLPDDQVVLLRSTKGQVPRMWPRESYLDNVAEAYQIDGSDYYTQVRPTDPYEAGGVSTSWPGGYRPPAGTGGGGITVNEELAGNKEIRLFWESRPSLERYRDSSSKNNWKDYVALVNSWRDGASRKAWGGSSIPSEQAKKSGKYVYYSGNSRKRANFKWNDYRDALNAWYESNREYFGKNPSYYVGPYIELAGATYTDGDAQKPVINVSTNVVAMPNLSDDDLYRQFCMSNVVTVTNVEGATSGRQVGGTLVCPNRSVKVETTGRRLVGFGRYEDIVVTNYPQIVCRHAYQDYVEQRGYLGRLQDSFQDTGKRSPMTRTLAAVSITGGYSADVRPFEAATGSDENVFKFSLLDEVEKGSVILVGTAAHPIEIKGPVYVDGDVVIRGFVTGQGTIYAGRNIHIVGDLVYLNPPSWPHSSAGLASDTPQAVAENNARRDLLVLAARGNIVIGDYTQSDWQSAFTSWAQSAADDSTVPRCNATDDSEIGYPASLNGFAHRYDQVERNGARKKVEFARSDSTYPGSEGTEEHTFYYYKFFPEVPKVTSGNLHYYETKLGDAVIAGLSQSKSTSSSGDLSSWSSSWIRRWIWKYLLSARMKAYLKGRESQIDYSDIADSIADDGDAGDITQIDAVLFANHGIFGKVGGSESKKFTLNGAMICRDDGLLPSFASRESGASMWLNWDLRIASDSAEGNTFVGASPDPESTRTVSDAKPRYEVRVSDWQQLR